MKALGASSCSLVLWDSAPWGIVGVRTGRFALTAHLSFSSKPRLLLLPVLCQRNFFSLLLVVQDAVPGDCLDQLLQALEQDSHVDPWVQALRDLLRQGPRAQEGSPRPTALSSTCQQQLRGLCQKIAQKKPEGQRKLNWCFSKQPGVPDSQGGECRKVPEESLELDSEREGKRLLLEEVAFEPLEPQECGDVAGVEEEVPKEPSGDTSAPSTDKAAPDNSQQDGAGELRKISQTELAAEVQSFVQVLCRVCSPLPASEPLQPDSHSFILFSSDAWTEAENAAAAGVQCKWLLLGPQKGWERRWIALSQLDQDKKPCWHFLCAWDTDTCLHLAGVRGWMWPAMGGREKPWSCVLWVGLFGALLRTVFPSSTPSCAPHPS